MCQALSFSKYWHPSVIKRVSSPMERQTLKRKINKQTRSLEAVVKAIKKMNRL